MDLEFRGANPLTYIVGEHARAVLAIQDLQREVNALLNFRDYVLHALPHLKSRSAPEAVPSEGTTQVAPHSAVVDSGFSTDKASTSMGKSSSFSGGETCGESRWGSTDHEETLEEAELNPPLGSCEDELWQLLEVIQRKGTKLRSELERAEMSEREHLPNSSDSSSSSSSSKQKAQDFWPHSLPPPGHGQHYDYYGFEPFAEVDRLRLDRSYLLSRISKAETEAAVSHTRLLDLHAQMMGLSTEKRRLEDALHATVQDASKIDNYLGYHLSSKMMMELGPRVGRQKSSVTVNSSESHYLPNPTWLEEDIMLPRILKVPIRDKGEERMTQKTKDSNYSTVASSRDSPIKIGGVDESREVHFSQPPATSQQTDGALQRQTSVSQIAGRGPHSDRVVIERQRACSKVDGGLSMPTSLLKGNKIKVNPDKQRISAILREKDVLALQKQLLTTVMETEVLKRQLECCSDEWVDKCSQFEDGQKKNCDIISSLTEENRQLKHKLDSLQNVPRSDVGVIAKPAVKDVAVSTENLDETDPTSMYEAPNVKYDVVVHEEVPHKNTRGIVEKPPRKRAVGPRLSSCSGDISFSSRDTVSSPRGHSRSSSKPVSSGNRISSSATPTSTLTNRHSRSSSNSVVPNRREVPARIGVGAAAPPASLRNQPFNKVPFLNDSSLTYNGGSASIIQKSGPESYIPRATPQLGYVGSTRGRHLPKAPLSVSSQTKYLPIDKTSRSYNRYSTGAPSSGSGIPSLIRGYVQSDSPKPRDFSEEQDRSDCSVDEVNHTKGAEAVRHKTLWRKPSGAIRIRTVGRPSVMSYLGKEALG